MGKLDGWMESLGVGEARGGGIWVIYDYCRTVQYEDEDGWDWDWGWGLIDVGDGY